jgi:hypothetical protein
LKRVQEDSGLAHEVDLGGPYKMQAFTPLIASKNQNTRPLGLELKEVKKLLLMWQGYVYELLRRLIYLYRNVRIGLVASWDCTQIYIPSKLIHPKKELIPEGGNH